MYPINKKRITIKTLVVGLPQELQQGLQQDREPIAIVRNKIKDKRGKMMITLVLSNGRANPLDLMLLEL